MINKNKAVVAAVSLSFLLISCVSINVASAQLTVSTESDSKSGSVSTPARSTKSTASDSKPITKDPVVSVNSLKLAAQETDLVAPRSAFISAGYVTPGTFNSFAGAGGDYRFPGNIYLASTTNTNSTSGAIYKGSIPFLHDFSLPGTTGRNTFLGGNAGNLTMTGSTGSQGSVNTGIGYYSLHANTRGSNNSALGYDSLTDNTTGNSNTAVGAATLNNNIEGSLNTAVGGFALFSNVNGEYNTANGFVSLYFNQADDNTAIGHGSLYGNTFGVRNVAVGKGALSDNTTGSNNVAVGPYAADNTSLGLLNMTSSTFIGHRANSSADGITNSTAIGAGAQVNRSNQVVIGNANVTQTVLRGNVSIGGRICVWNGANYTLVSFAPNSIVPIYSTSTSC